MVSGWSYPCNIRKRCQSILSCGRFTCVSGAQSWWAREFPSELFVKDQLQPKVFLKADLVFLWWGWEFLLYQNLQYCSPLFLWLQWKPFDAAWKGKKCHRCGIHCLCFQNSKSVWDEKANKWGNKSLLYVMMPCSARCYLMPIPGFIPVSVPYESLPWFWFNVFRNYIGMRYSRRKYILEIQCLKEISSISPVISTKGAFRE